MILYKIEELTKTVWQSYDKISNEIPAEYIPNAQKLIDLMIRISHKWNGSKIPYTCAYRGAKLNKKMGGVPNSMHQKACAMDCIILLKDQDKFMTMLKEHFGDEIDFAQNYIYRIKKGMRIPRNFVHINIPNNGETPRKIFNTEIDKGNKIVFGSQGSSLDLFKRQ